MPWLLWFGPQSYYVKWRIINKPEHDTTGCPHIVMHAHMSRWVRVGMMCIELSCFVPSLLYQDNETPLFAASKKGHHDVVQSLLGAGAEVNIAFMPSVSGMMLMPME